MISMMGNNHSNLECSLQDQLDKVRQKLQRPLIKEVDNLGIFPDSAESLVIVLFIFNTRRLVRK